MAQAIGSTTYLIDTGLYRPGLAACYLVADGDELAIIDTGTMHSLPRVLDAIDSIGARPEQVRYVVPTHVHLDHAGGAGQLMRACSHARLLVHPKGLPHMLDPSKLQAGATAVYGEAAFARDFGELLPIDPDRAEALDDGATFALGKRTLQFLDTPGHANHHGCIHDRSSGYLFTGDTFGLGYAEFRTNGRPLLVATTTPVAFDPEAWYTSLERMMALDPSACCLTHFGRLDEPGRHVDMLRDSIAAHVDIALAEEDNEAPGRDQRLLEAVRALLVNAGARHSGLPEAEVERLLAQDIELNAQGLGVWLVRRAKRRAG
jgi:glyoxylase-like metal-dependent hydrolase (beta-lactamase superfamily II)